MAIAKSIQFTDIFKDELREVIYSNEHLILRSDLEDIWQKVTDALCQQKFSAINRKLLKNIKDYYLPINQDYYYKDYNLDADIEKDQENDGYVLIQEETKVIVVVENKKGCDYTFSGIIPYPEDDDNRSFYELYDLEINGKKVDLNKNDHLKMSRSNGYINIDFNYHCNSSKTEYTIVRKERKRYALSVNPYRSHRAVCLYNNFFLDLNYPKDMEIDWIDMGVLGKWTKNRKDTNSSNRIKAQYNGLIFRNQGFLLIFS